MEKFTVTIGNTGESFHCSRDRSVLHGMEALGRKGIPVGCRGGGCGVCKVRIRSGAYHTRRMSRACVSEAEQEAGVVLACRLFAEGDLELDVIGRMEAALVAGAPAGARCLEATGQNPRE